MGATGSTVGFDTAVHVATCSAGVRPPPTTGTEIVRVPPAEATTALKSVPRERWDEAVILFG